MDILIKGMEMPKDTGSITVTIYSDGSTGIWTEQEMIAGGMAVALPEHGDLIDADVLDEKIKKLWFIPKQTKTEYMVAVEKTIANAPVIVEATE